MCLRLLALLSLLLLFAMNSCGSAGSISPESQLGDSNPANDSVVDESLDVRFQDWLAQQALLGNTPEGMSDIPPIPLDFGKGSSEGEGEGGDSGSLSVLGSDFILENGASLDGSSAVLHVGDDAGMPAFAMYRFSGLLGTRPLSLNVECLPGSLDDRYYVGVADYTNYTWRWFGPSELPEFPINLGEQDWSFISNLGNMYFVIAVQPGMVATHSQSTLLFGPNEPPSFPGSPTELVASDGEFTEGVALSWNAAHGAEWYRILRRVQAHQGPNGGDGEPGADFGFIGESVEPAYFDETAALGVIYEYKVQARNHSGMSSFSNIDSGYAGEGGGGGEFDLFGAWVEENTAIVLEWGGPEHAVFTVWKAVGEGEFDDIAVTEDHRFVDVHVEHNVVYHYKVSYVGEHGALIFSNTVHLVHQGDPNGGEFELFGFFSEDKTHVVLEWNEKEGHTGYDIYRRTGDGEWHFRAETLDNRYEDDDVVCGVHYYYKVKAYRGELEPQWSNEVHVFCEEGGDEHCDFQLFGHFNEGGTAVLMEWEVKEGHNGYMVQKRIGDGEWFNLDDTSLNHYTDEAVEQGVWYAYRIKAFRGENLEPCLSNVIELFFEGEGGGDI